MVFDIVPPEVIIPPTSIILCGFLLVEYPKIERNQFTAAISTNVPTGEQWSSLIKFWLISGTNKAAATEDIAFPASGKAINFLELKLVEREVISSSCLYNSFKSVGSCGISVKNSFFNSSAVLRLIKREEVLNFSPILTILEKYFSVLSRLSFEIKKSFIFIKHLLFLYFLRANSNSIKFNYQ